MKFNKILEYNKTTMYFENSIKISGRKAKADFSFYNVVNAIICCAKEARASIVLDIE